MQRHLIHYFWLTIRVNLLDLTLALLRLFSFVTIFYLRVRWLKCNLFIFYLSAFTLIYPANSSNLIMYQLNYPKFCSPP